jgi:starch-binding outer membrane protein, SusD/RagB family
LQDPNDSDAANNNIFSFFIVSFFLLEGQIQTNIIYSLYRIFQPVTSLFDIPFFKFTEAYYHYWLVRMYGPIPLVKENISVDAPTDETKVYRNTLDECFEYIISLLDEVIDNPYMLDKIENETEELGRVSKAVVYAMKAEIMMTAASPLFNGNTDYLGFTDNRGVEIFNPQKSEAEKLKKWEDAAEACCQAIEFCKGVGYDLFKMEYFDYSNMSDDAKQVMQLRQILYERWNCEMIWENSNSWFQYQGHCMPRGWTSETVNNSSGATGNMGVSLKIAEQYYTKNGIPMEEDKEWNYENRFAAAKVGNDNAAYMAIDQWTANFNLNREPRYYASLGFDRGIWMGQGTKDVSKSNYLKARAGEPAANAFETSWCMSGIWPKKLVHDETVLTKTNITYQKYPFPIMRMANLYLLYAEALNEIKAPYTEVLPWIDKVRERAGLEGVETAWTNHSTDPEKFKDQTGLREIIHQERLIELSLEGQRYWDIRRWKKALTEFNKPVTGWNLLYNSADDYYKETLIYNQTFTVRDYFWPIVDAETWRNKNLKQNYGW